MDHIDEFQSPNFHGLAQKCFLALLLFTVAVLAVRGRRVALERRADCIVRGVCGALCFAEYSGVFHSAGDGGGSAAAVAADWLGDSCSE